MSASTPTVTQDLNNEGSNERALHAWVQQKGQRPRVPGTLLQRSHILGSTLTRSPVVWMAAPAGFGKSLLMHSYAETIKDQTSIMWFSCDHLDNSPATLLQHLLVAAKQQLPIGSEDALSLLDQPETQHQFDKILLLWLRDIGVSEQPCLLLIDNVHELLEDGCWYLIQCLIRYRPENVQLVISGRYRPHPLGSLTLTTDIQLINDTNLRLSLAEQRQLLELQGLNCSSEQHQSLYHRFEGWFAGLALWCHCYRAAGQPKIAPKELGSFEIGDYLQGEILCHLPAEQQRFLQYMAVLGTANETLMSSVMGADYHQQLQACLHMQTFIEVSKERQDWYRMPATMAECLVQLLSREQREQLHREAYRWLSQHQEPVAALYHATQLQSDRDQVVRWIEAEAENILAQLDMQGLLVWFDQLDNEVLTARPRLMQIAAWARLLTHQRRQADSLIERLMDINFLAPYELAALQGYSAMLRGDHKLAQSLCQKSYEALPNSRFTLRILMCSTLCHIAMANKDSDNARVWNRESQDLARKFRVPAMEALSLYDHARIELNRGHIQRGLQIIDQGLAILDNRPSEIELLPRGRLTLYRCLLMWLSGAGHRQFDSSLQRGIDIATKVRDINVCYGYAVAAMQLSSLRRFNEALDILDVGERQMQHWGVEPISYQWLHIVRANVWISQGKLNRAQQCIDRLLGDDSALSIPQPELFPMLPGFTLATQARIHLVSYRIDQCLAETEQWLKQNHDGLMTVFVRLVRGGAFAINNQAAESQHQFNLVRKQLELDGIGLEIDHWLPDLASVLKAPDPSSVNELSIHVHLSDREQEVLSHMAQGLSNQEIADRLFISLHTVKTHARKINVKLGAKSRTQAIHRAKELMLI